MKFPRTYTLEEIAGITQTEFIGSPEFPVTGINEIHVVQPGDVVFVDHPKYYDKALESAATVILINKKVECPEGKALLISDDPFRDFNRLSVYFRPFQTASGSISATAKIGKDTIIQPNVFIGNHVEIGENCVIHPNVTIYDNCIIGDHVTIHSGTVLGTDAFYYKNRESGFDKLISCGRVVIEDHVDIGSACTIDRGVTGDTTIKEGSKIDNQVQIAHDTVIGKKCLIASQVGIAGCTVIEDEVTLWGQVGIVSGITIGEKAVVLAQSGVSKSLEGGKVYFGSPVGEARDKYKEMALIRKLPEMIKKLK
jgi:UDP-3-O-[3-hydroxymyristoyl] glucosamine N-acyltransferase